MGKRWLAKRYYVKISKDSILLTTIGSLNATMYTMLTNVRMC